MEIFVEEMNPPTTERISCIEPYKSTGARQRRLMALVKILHLVYRFEISIFNYFEFIGVSL